MVNDRREITRTVLRRGIVNGQLRPDTDVKLATRLLSAPTMMSMLGFVPRLEVEQPAERAVDAVPGGVAGD